MSKRTSNFNDFLVEQLRDSKFAAAYLNEHYGYRGPNRKEHNPPNCLATTHCVRWNTFDRVCLLEDKILFCS